MTEESASQLAGFSRRRFLQETAGRAAGVLLLLGLMVAGSAGRAEERPIAGTIHLASGERVEFENLLSLIFSIREGEESIPQNVSEWSRHYDSASASRSVPLAWVRSIEIVKYELQQGYRCVFNPEVSIQTVTGAEIPARYKTFEWIKVAIKSRENGRIESRHVYFATGDELHIKWIEFHH